MKKLFLAPLLIVCFSASSVFAWISQNDTTIKNLENTCKTYDGSVSKYLDTVLLPYLDNTITLSNQDAISQYTKSIEAASEDILLQENLEYIYGLNKLPPVTQLLFRSVLNTKKASEIQTLAISPDWLKSFIIKNDTLLKFCNDFPQYKSKILAEKEDGYIAMYKNEMNSNIKDMKDLMRAQNLEQIKLKNKKFAPAIKKEMNLKFYKLIQFIKQISKWK